MTRGDGPGFRLSDHPWRRSIAPRGSPESTGDAPADESATAEPSAGSSSLAVTTTATLLLSVAAAVGAHQKEWAAPVLAGAAVAALAGFVRRAGIHRQRRPGGLSGAGLKGMLVVCYVAWAYAVVAGWIAIFRWLPSLA